MPQPASTHATVDVHQEGLVLRPEVGEGVMLDVALDVCFDGRRVWSFRSLRDSEPGDRPGEVRGTRRIAWPRPLHRFLDGVTRISVVEHVSGVVLVEREERFGRGLDRIAVVNKAGNPLGIDNSGRLSITFDSRSPTDVAPLLEAVDEVLAALREAGVEAFVAYGTLLGAVREGRLIGHDSDADLGYVSRFEDPLDVCRESFTLQRQLHRMGYTTQRYSGIAFRIEVVEGDGAVRGLDVFGGFHDHGMLWLMGEVGVPFEREWIFPLGSASLEGRPVPVPARPEKLLEAMYGPSWAVPDPAFKFETPVHVRRRLNGWFRGTRVYRNAWSRSYSGVHDRPPPADPSGLARFVMEQEGDPGRVVDLGAGRGQDALWFARQGLEVTAYDYLLGGSHAARTEALREGLRLETVALNLLEWRSVLAVAAREAHREGPRTLVARHLADATTTFGRGALWRLASAALQPGGRLYLEHWAGGAPPDFHHSTMLRTDEVVRGLESAGAQVVHREQYDVPTGRDGVDDGTGRTRTIGRVVAQWRA